MRHLRHHAADRGVIRTLDHLVQPGKSQSSDDQLVLHWRLNRGTYPLELDLSAALARCLCHITVPGPTCHGGQRRLLCSSAASTLRRWVFFCFVGWGGGGVLFCRSFFFLA